MPREVFASSAEKVVLRDYEEPALGPGQARIKSEFGAAKHGTELAVLRGYAGSRGAWDAELRVFQGQNAKGSPGPMAVGNMAVGRIVQLGAGVSEFREGDRVLTYGGFRETHTVKALSGVQGDGRVLVRIPEELDWRSAVCLDPAAYALSALRDGQFRIGDAVALFSMGAIGLMALQWARAGGAGLIIAIEPLEGRRALAKRLGADLCLDPGACDVGLEIKKATQGRGTDIAVEYSGNSRALQAALRGAGFGGTVVCGAFPPPYSAGLDFGAESHMNRPRIIFTRAASDPNADHPRWSMARVWQEAWNAILAGRLSGQDVVSPVVPLAEVPAAYLRMAADPSSSVKLGTHF